MTYFSRFRVAWLVNASLVLSGCVDSNAPKIYEVRGVVRELLPDGKTARIQHEKIPGYMEAMTMPLSVRDPVELKDVNPGDVVSFRMLVTKTDGWIDQVRVLTNAAEIQAAQPVPPDPVINVLPNVPELTPGDVVPNYTFTNELGRVIHLEDFRGKALAVTFIFTRCPFPTFCPRMTDHFKAVQKELKADATAPKNWQLLSLSFDPGFDTPATLRNYGKARSYDPESWSLATGDMGQIAPLAQHFGLYFTRTSQPQLQNHNLRTVVIDPTGRVHKTLIGNEWTPTELAADIRTAALKK